MIKHTWSLPVLSLVFFLPIALASAQTSGSIGFTYTQDQIFISQAQGSQVANIQLYGWGTYWPFPEGKSGEYDGGETIERRIQQAVKDGQSIVLTCATAPSIYRQSGKPWNMEECVKPDMEDQYALRCAQVVQRWPQITRVQVWNELKGYWDTRDNRWDYVAYTRFYNKVYHAVKAVRPDLLVGGGYVVMSPKGYFDKPYAGVLMDTRAVDALQYWIAHADGYDAVCLDGQFEPDSFLKVTSLVRNLTHDKPIWWAEYYGKNVQDMRATRVLFSRNQHPGDMALWWAETRFPW